MTPEVSDIREAISKLRRNSVEPMYPKAHASCCRGQRLGTDHSAYCFTLRGFYVGVIHPEAMATFSSAQRRALRRRSK